MMATWALIICALGSCTIHLFFVWRMRLIIASRQQSTSDTINQELSNDPHAGVSVIVCAKNEALRLDTLIPKILEQNYQNFELIIVDDHSTDQTQLILDQWSTKDPRVKGVTPNIIKARQHGKKAALTYGIAKASNNLLLMTDADCVPSSVDWIDLMTAPLRAGKSVALGYGGYNQTSGFLNALIRYETTLTGGLYLGQALAGHPYMGVGRNLAYQKEFFVSSGGFDSHEHIPSGDDDLLINHRANSTNTGVVIDPNAFTWSEPKTTWMSLLRQKRRHQTTANLYRMASKITLSLYSGSILLFYISVLLLFFNALSNPNIYWILLGLLTLRSAYLIGFMGPIFSRLKSPDLRPWTPLLEPVLIYMQLVIFVWNSVSKPNHWN